MRPPLEPPDGQRGRCGYCKALVRWWRSPLTGAESPLDELVIRASATGEGRSVTVALADGRGSRLTERVDGEFVGRVFHSCEGMREDRERRAQPSYRERR